MIQEKDFLYRVPVKTAPITTPGGQIRNPEILVDIEGGEFMHGNILDANSTNKLINQSVDNKITEGGYVTKNLLDAETTRATAKENEIKAQVDIINGDSTTEGSFRKAIADVVAAAPEDLDTLKEIADKLAGNDDLHTALNQAITEKADTSALLNEVTRATGVENNLKATLVNYALNSDVEEKLAQKADTTMLSEFIDKTSTEEQAINSPLHAKEYISVFHNTADETSGIKITNSGILAIDQLNENASPNKVFATDGSIADLSQYAKKSEIAPLPTNIVTASAVSDRYFGFEKSIEIYSEAINKIMTIGYIGINFQTDKNDVAINEDGFFISSDSDDTDLCSFTTSGIKFAGKTSTDIPTANGTFINITEQIDNAVNDYNFISQQQADSRYALADTFSSLNAGLSKKQNKITVNSVDVTDIETADAEKLRTIVTNLTNALSESGLIRLVKNVE